MSQDLLNVYDVFGAVVFHCAFPVAECFEGYSQDPWVFQFAGDSFSLLFKMRKTKKLIIYEDRETGSLFIRATKIDKRGDFRLKDDSYGKAISGNVTDAELGKAVREILQNCD